MRVASSGDPDLDVPITPGHPAAGGVFFLLSLAEQQALGFDPQSESLRRRLLLVRRRRRRHRPQHTCLREGTPNPKAGPHIGRRLGQRADGGAGRKLERWREHKFGHDPDSGQRDMPKTLAKGAAARYVRSRPGNRSRAYFRNLGFFGNSCPRPCPPSSKRKARLAMQMPPCGTKIRATGACHRVSQPDAGWPVVWRFRSPHHSLPRVRHADF